MIKRCIIVLLMILVMTSCAYQFNNESENIELKEDTYKELSMQSLVDAKAITRIKVFYNGEEANISNSTELDKQKIAWEKSFLKNAEVSLLKEEVEPGFLYTITLTTMDDSKVRHDYVFTIIRDTDTTLEISYITDEKTEYRLVGTANDSFENFLKECVEAVK